MCTEVTIKPSKCEHGENKFEPCAKAQNSSSRCKKPAKTERFMKTCCSRDCCGKALKPQADEVNRMHLLTEDEDGEKQFGAAYKQAQDEFIKVVKIHEPCHELWLPALPPNP